MKENKFKGKERTDRDKTQRERERERDRLRIGAGWIEFRHTRSTIEFWVVCLNLK